MGHPRISIVIPAYNEALRLPPTLNRLISELDDLIGSEWQIVVSDDGSSDSTADLALEIARSESRVVVVTSEVNHGKGAALVDGFAAATSPLVVFLDADLPVEPAALVPLIDAASAAEMVVGSRRMPDSSFTSPQPWSRRFGGGVFLQMVAVLGLRTTSDPQCGVKVIQREPVAKLMAATTSTGYAFDIELITRARRSGLRVVERPVRWHHAEGSCIRPVRDGAATMKELIKMRRRLWAEGS